MKRSKSGERQPEVAPGCNLALSDMNGPHQHILGIDWPIKLAIELCQSFEGVGTLGLLSKVGLIDGDRL